jgi:nucleotide-binding universal stress UspA family protein
LLGAYPTAEAQNPHSLILGKPTRARCAVPLLTPISSPFAEAQKADVIVMGTHGGRGYDRLTLGSVTNRVMRAAPCPVLAVCNAPRDLMREGEEHGQVHRLTRILFCTDFSNNSETALKYAISATEEYDAELTLLHVLEEIPSKSREGTIKATTEQLEKLIPRRNARPSRLRRQCASESRTSKSFNSHWKRRLTWWLWECEDVAH